MMAGFVSVAAPALGITLYAVGSRSPSGLPHSIRLTLALSFLITGTGCLGAILCGRFLLSTFGGAYASEGSLPLIILTLAMLPGIVKVHFIQVQRIAGRIGIAAAIVAAGAVLELSAAALGARQGGLVGLSEWYMASVVLEAVIMTPSVLRAAGLVFTPKRSDAAELEKPARVQYTCERCRTRFVLVPPPRRLGIGGRLRALAFVLGRSILFYQSPGASYDEARRELLSGVDAEAYESFAQSFKYCLECRRFVCAECWSATGRCCLSCLRIAMTGATLARTPFMPALPEAPRPSPPIGGSVSRR